PDISYEPEADCSEACHLVPELSCHRFGQTSALRAPFVSSLVQPNPLFSFLRPHPLSGTEHTLTSPLATSVEELIANLLHTLFYTYLLADTAILYCVRRESVLHRYSRDEHFGELDGHALTHLGALAS